MTDDHMVKIRARYADQISKYYKYYEPHGLFDTPHLKIGMQGFAFEYSPETRDDQHREWLGIMLCAALDNLVRVETISTIEAAVQAEREACASLCDEYSKDHGQGMFDRHSNACAEMIRDRGLTGGAA
ncbi:hypothetical protein [Sulfitobacter sp. 20_GPM-1509m]|uniref:hypothetical protein n=1 Tax=Sulfitobacter sp. 20_GPM-1509m TaxID=1380367 RepID=UPI00048D3694|nr:hypothetical protein [Sulfitobacter sp. 20_GPM-1509m]